MTTIEEVVSYMRKIQRRYPGIQVYFHNTKSDKRTFTELATSYTTTLDLDDAFEPVAVNVPVE
ncbi:hypothetical protein KA005_40260 [bacterium]|nr:hypothetical protein [bacterium]